ncbi:sigmaY antisigma factor component [Bacillaceae bacterium Marseille-Q3522]|nr:sigmaY antisigma factor component [Bacillaceae bacterium Marseille-Q3522]
MNKSFDIPIWLLILLIFILLIQGTYIFLDARKRGHARWFWGIWGMTSTPTPLLIYLLWSRFLSPHLKNRKNKHD